MDVGGGFQCLIRDLQSSQMSGNCSVVPEGSMGSSARGVLVLGSAMGA